MSNALADYKCQMICNVLEIVEFSSDMATNQNSLSLSISTTHTFDDEMARITKLISQKFPSPIISVLF